MPFTTQELANEINNDQTALGLVAMKNAGNAEGIRDALNLRRATITVGRDDVTPQELLEAINIADLQPDTNANSTRLSAAYLESVLQFRLLPLFKPDGVTPTLIKTNLDAMVRNNNGSQTRLNAVAKRNGSRAEQLWGLNFGVTTDQVAAAINPAQ